MRIQLLGPLRAHRDDGEPITIGGARLRALLAELALHPGRPASVERLIGALWAQQPPTGATNALQSLISRLRRVLAAAGPETISGTAAGYQLDIDPDHVDTHRFTTLAARGRTRRDTGDTTGAIADLQAALDLWRGTALADVTAPFTGPASTRLRREHLDTIAVLAESRLEAGQPDHAAALLDEPAANHPLDERLATLAVRALHHAGRQADALACFGRTRHALADELGVDPSPDLAAAHLAVLRGRPTHTRPPAAPTAGTPTNLHAPLSSFIGRDRELTELRKLVADSRLVTLVGPGGIGKTRLATEAAAGLLDTHPDGVWLVELAPVTNPADIAHTILTAVGGHALLTTTRGAPTAVPDRAGQLLDTLVDRHALLIIDNCEHLIAATAHVVDMLLAHCPGVRILATSRAGLGLTGEQLYPIAALDLPATDADPATARHSAAIRLLADRATAVRPNFTVTDTNLAAVTTICQHLDGAPLALELAAARLRALSPAQLADRLDDRFGLLTAGNRVAQPRHQSLRAVVDWSWELLTDHERALARRLSIFPGGATLDAAESVCADHDADGPLPDRAVLPALTGLVDQSLLDATHPDAAAGPRYRMLETIRAYGAEALAAAGETDRLRRAHLRHHLQLAESTAPQLRTRAQDHAMAVFGAEHDNLLAALRHAIDTHDTGNGLRLGAALLWYWMLTGYATDGSRLLRDIVDRSPAPPPDQLASHYALCAIGAELTDLPAQLGDPNTMQQRVDRLAQLIAHADAVGPLHPLLRIASAFPPIIRGEPDTCRQILDTLVTDSDDWTRAAALLLRANVLTDALDHIDQAGADAAAAVETFRNLGERWGLSMALVGYGEQLVSTGELTHAAAVLAEAWQVASNFIPERERPDFLLRLAGIRVRAGDIDAAEADLEHATALRAAHPAHDETDNHHGDLVIADVHRRRGRYAQARSTYRHVLELAESRPSLPPQFGAMALTGLAAVEHDTGHLDQAAGFLDRALRVLAAARDLPVLAVVIEGVIVLAGSRGEHERVAVLAGALDQLQHHIRRHDPPLLAAVDDAVAHLGRTDYERHRRRGAGLDFVGVYDYLGVPAGPPGPYAQRHTRGTAT